MTDVNIPLLRKAVEWAEAEAMKPPELCEWEQKWWAIPANTDAWFRNYRRDRAPECGTTYCIAGYVAQAVGAEVSSDFQFPHVAAAALGIRYDEFDYGTPGQRLFHALNSIEDVRRIAEEIAGERL